MRPQPTRPIRSASVLVPTWQGMEFLERVLDALAAQRAGFPWDVHVIDSGSSDGTWEHLLARRAGFPVPLHTRAIRQVEFDHGDTRNLLAARSAGDLLVYLTQDAVPSTPDWLALLARNFEDPLVGAAYCRNVARRDARLLTVVFCRSDPGYSEERVERRMPDPAAYARMSADERRLLCSFNNVASAVRRELWERHPFPRTTMGEDVLIARGIIEAGYTVVYDAEATVDHSHDYGPEKMLWRGRVDGKFNAEWMGRTCIASEGDLGTLTGRLVADDARVLQELGGAEDELEQLRDEARVLRAAILRGLYEGGLSPRRYPRTAMRDRTDVHVLYVVHGFPPEGRSGDAGGHTLEIAREMRRRGHRVTVLALSAAAEDGRLRLWRDDADGLAVVRAREPGEPAVLEAAFRCLLVCEQPDLVHFQTLRASSVGLVRAARDLGLATVASLHDDRALRDGERATLEAAGLADLRISPDAALREAFLAAGDLDPQTLACCEHSRSAPEAAAELEYRYRALCCIVRADRGGRPLLEASGAQARAQGETTPQGTDWLLLRPGSAAEYPLAGLPAGALVLELEQFALAAERDITLGGRALIDGVEVGLFAPAGAVERDRAVRQIVECDLPQGARVLRLEPCIEGSGRELHLRVCRLALRPRPSVEELFGTRPARPAADLALLAEELRVGHGPAVDRGQLPRVTVVVPNLDGRDVLPDCLASIAALDYERERLEVVLVDNGSSDGSVELVRERFPEVRVLPQERNLGFAAACNAGARAANGAEVLAFLNNDMRFEPDFLIELVSPLVRRECAATTAKILGWDGRTIDTSGTGMTFLGIAVQPGYGQPPRPEHDVPRKTLFGCGAAMAVDAAVFRDVGGFDEEYFAYYEDLDLGWRMWVLGRELHYVPRALCYHHHSHTSARFPPEVVRLVMIRNSLYTCVKNYDDANLARILPVLLSLAIRRAHLKAELDEGPFRIQDVGLVGAPGWGPDSTGGTVEIGRMGASDLIGINDLLGSWDHWMRRRREVQSRRTRADDEIQRLFLEPLACVEGDPSYGALQESLVAMFGLDRTFGRS